MGGSAPSRRGLHNAAMLFRICAKNSLFIRSMRHAPSHGKRCKKAGGHCSRVNEEMVRRRHKGRKYSMLRLLLPEPPNFDPPKIP